MRMKTKSLDRVELLGHGLALIAMLCYSFKVCTQVTGPLVLIVAVCMLIVSVIGYIKSKNRYRMSQNKNASEKKLLNFRKMSIFLYIGIFFIFGENYFQHPIYPALGAICITIVMTLLYKYIFVSSPTK